MFRSQDIQLFVFLSIPCFTESTHEITKLGQLIDISKGNNFLESFEQFGGLGLGSRSFSI